MARNGHGKKQAQARAVEMLRAELKVAIDDALLHAPRRYRLIQWIAVHTQRFGFVGRWFERRRQRSYELRVESRVRIARLMAEAGLPRRYRRALQGDAMAASVRPSVRPPSPSTADTGKTSW